MKTEQLTEVMQKHAAWLRHEDGGEGANLSGADLHGADLSGANLRGANLRYALLDGADLRGANLSEANLLGVNLSGADLRGADLRGANLRGAILSEAKLRGAKLHGADLRGADLGWADLRGANLRGAKGILLLPVQDMRGYSNAHAMQCLDGEWRIRVGCRDFSIDEARAHWGSPDYPDRQRGDDYLYAVEWLHRRTAQPASQGDQHSGQRAGAPAACGEVRL